MIGTLKRKFLLLKVNFSLFPIYIFLIIPIISPSEEKKRGEKGQREIFNFLEGYAGLYSVATVVKYLEHDEEARFVLLCFPFSLFFLF